MVLRSDPWSRRTIVPIGTSSLRRSSPSLLQRARETNDAGAVEAGHRAGRAVPRHGQLEVKSRAVRGRGSDGATLRSAGAHVLFTKKGLVAIDRVPPRGVDVTATARVVDALRVGQTP